MFRFLKIRMIFWGEMKEVVQRNKSEDIRIIAMTVSRNSIGHWSNTKQLHKIQMSNINLQESNIYSFFPEYFIIWVEEASTKGSDPGFHYKYFSFWIQENLWMLICFTFSIYHLRHLYWERECGLQIDFSPFRKFCCLSYSSATRILLHTSKQRLSFQFQPK